MTAQEARAASAAKAEELNKLRRVWLVRDLHKAIHEAIDKGEQSASVNDSHNVILVEDITPFREQGYRVDFIPTHYKDGSKRYTIEISW